MRKITKLLFTAMLLIVGVGVNIVMAQGGTKTPLLLLKNGVINSTDFDITPVAPSTLTTENLYAATFTSKDKTKNVFKYENLDVRDYDKAVIKYSILDANEWRVNTPTNHYALPSGTDQTYEIDLSGVDTYNDFTVFSSYQNHTVGSSITISEVYLYKSSGIKTPILLTGGKFSECFVPGTYYIEMNGWQNFTVYENPTGIAFDENSTMVFDMPEQSNNDQVRVVFTYDDASTSEIWWCTGIGSSADDPAIQWNHKLDNSTFWLKKGLGTNFDSKKDLKITKVTVNNQNFTGGIYKINGGTICGETMTIKKQGQWYDPTVFGAYGGEFRATAGFTNIFQMKPFEVGDNQKIVIKFSEPVPSTGNWNLNNNSGLTSLSGKTEYEFALDGTAISDFTIFNWDKNPDPIKISEVYFYKTVIEASEIIEAPSSTRDLNGMTGKGEIRWSLSYPIEMGPAIGIGGDLNTDNNSVDISSYDYLHFYVTSVETGKKLSARVFVSEEERNDNDKRHCLYLRPIADAANPSTNWEEVYYITEPGTYVAKISDYPLLRGIKGGNGYGGDESTGKITIPQAYLSSGDPVDYIPSGKYTLVGEGVASASLTTALADANATFYDATGVTGTGVDLTGAANPNALFKANAGVLANTQNVITSGTCANLVLTDNHPFKAPAAFTATAAPTYDRSFAASTTTTVCLPFALTSAEASSLGTFYELSSVDGSTLTFTSVDAPLANKAYLVKTTDTSLTLSETGKSIVATPADLSTTVSSIDFIGTLTSTTLPASDGTTDYYAFNNGSLVKIVTNEATLPPFRAYFKVTNGGDVKAFNLKFEDTETGIDSLSPTPSPVSEGSIFNVAGQRMSKLQKGVNILNGHKVLVK